MDPGREEISAAELELGRLGSGQHPSSSRRQSICKAAFWRPRGRAWMWGTKTRVDVDGKESVKG